MILFKKLNSKTTDALVEFQKLLKKGEIAEAKKRARSHVFYCKQALGLIEKGIDSKKRSEALVIGIWFRGMENFCNLIIIENTPEWIRDVCLQRC